jgi:hypothetical protein
VLAGLPLLGLAGRWALALVLDWHGRCHLGRLPFLPSLAIVSAGAVGLMALLVWLTLLALAALWQAMWRALLSSALLLLAFLLAFRLAAWRVRTPLRLDRAGLASGRLRPSPARAEDRAGPIPPARGHGAAVAGALDASVG